MNDKDRYIRALAILETLTSHNSNKWDRLLLKIASKIIEKIGGVA